MRLRPSKPTAQAKSKTPSLETPFETRRRELAEQEAELKAAADRHESFIKKAPKIAERIQKEQRERFLINASTVNRGGGQNPYRLPDDRHLDDRMLRGDATGRPRERRRERQQGKWMFFVLVATLFIAAWWAWQTLFQPSF